MGNLWCYSTPAMTVICLGIFITGLIIGSIIGSGITMVINSYRRKSGKDKFKRLFFGGYLDSSFHPTRI